MQAENVLKYYVLCNKLKTTIRSGWKVWQVNKERVESVAEHIYSVQQLAIAMYSQYNYDIDLEKVILMLAIHETEETLIGDLTPYDSTEEEKQKLGHQAILKALEPLNIKDRLVDLILEFDARESKEALFAYYCDKLECDLQCKMYDEEQCVNIHDPENQRIKDNPELVRLVAQGNSWSGLWINNDLEKIGFDENFAEVDKYARDNDIHSLIEFFK